MPILENYRHYFDIDPDYFPAVNEAVINSKPDMWKNSSRMRRLLNFSKTQ